MTAPGATRRIALALVASVAILGGPAVASSGPVDPAGTDDNAAPPATLDSGEPARR
jgi:hypothetical protein